MKLLSELLLEQMYSFLAYILSGVLIGIFFDIFRILRKSFKTNNIVTYIQDILFWIVTGLFILYVIFKFDNGELRSYIFIGLLLGMVLYLLLFSKMFINIMVNVILCPIIKLIRNIFEITKKAYYLIKLQIMKTIKRIKCNIIKNKKLQKSTKI